MSDRPLESAALPSGLQGGLKSTLIRYTSCPNTPSKQVVKIPYILDKMLPKNASTQTEAKKGWLRTKFKVLQSINWSKYFIV